MGVKMAKGDDIMERLVSLSVDIARVCDALPRSPVATHIAHQLVRCGTSPAANYAEARSGESRKDFVHKMNVALKELNECSVWLQLLRRLSLPGAEEVDGILGECDELCRIFSVIIRTASGREKPRQPTD
jgi:four helix bundle protein